MSDSNPIVSILLPSRARPERLRCAIDSCFDKSGNPAEVEAIIRLDYDDPELSSILEWSLRQPRRIKTIVGPRLRGYMDLFLFTNECARASSGQWLFPFNDDAWFGSENWIALLPKPNGKMVIYPRVDRPIDRDHPRYVDFAKGPRFDFPVISRSLYEVLGVYCPTLIYDWFWYEAVHRFPKLGGKIIPDLLVWHEYLRQPEGVNEFSIENDPKVAEHKLPENQTKIETAMQLLERNL